VPINIALNLELDTKIKYELLNFATFKIRLYKHFGNE